MLKGPKDLPSVLLELTDIPLEIPKKSRMPTGRFDSGPGCAAVVYLHVLLRVGQGLV